jgi:hypothetical protein
MTKTKKVKQGTGGLVLAIIKIIAIFGVPAAVAILLLNLAGLSI